MTAKLLHPQYASLSFLGPPLSQHVIMADWDLYVRPIWSMISRNLLLSSELSAALFQEGLLSYRDLEEIKARATSYEKNISLVWNFLAYRGPGTLEKFCHALKIAGPPNDYVSVLIEEAMAKDQKTSSRRDAESCASFGGGERGGFHRGRDNYFPSDDSEVTEELMKAVVRVGYSRWEEILCDLVPPEEIYEQRGSSKVKLMMGITNWRIRSEMPAVWKLMKACEHAGISRRVIEETYHTIY
eukprot:m.252022 g.252022  ORF g.252022 m.252022 type:complete len:242 (+) comp40343_c6_seq9:1022-1747(+)